MIIESYPDKVIININMLVQSYYMGNTEFLKYALYQIKHTLDNRPVHIDALRNTPLNIAPYRGIVDLIVEELDLPASEILLHIRDQKFSHPGVSVIPHNNWDEQWRLHEINKYFNGLENLTESIDVKRFGCLFNRMQLGRLLIAHHLDFHHRDNSFVTFHCDKINLDHQIFGIDEYFSDIREWWMARKNPQIDCLGDTSSNSVDWPNSITSYPEVARYFQIEIVSETDYCRLGDYTEKTWRCLATGKPFILLCGAGSMAELRRLGFKTYHPLIDESYDEIDNLHERIKAIKKEIDRLAAMDQQEWLDTLENLNAIAMENKNFYRNWEPNIQYD